MPVSEDRISLCINCCHSTKDHHASGRCLYAPLRLEIYKCAGCHRPFEYDLDHPDLRHTLAMTSDDYHVGCTTDIDKTVSW
jgi:hypothetical protein